jgi:hypothetical protein
MRDNTAGTYLKIKDHVKQENPGAKMHTELINSLIVTLHQSGRLSHTNAFLLYINLLKPSGNFTYDQV